MDVMIHKNHKGLLRQADIALDPGPTGRRGSPRCFMHIPKSAGMSIRVALEAALAPDSLCPRQMDTSIFCDFDRFDLMKSSTRKLIAVDSDEIVSMGTYPAISGHFTLASLLSVAQAQGIGTILREPRARLLSLYAYWRIPDIFKHVFPYSVQEYAHKPLAEFLSEPLLAPATDNQVCRMLLHGDPRMPRDAFIAGTYVDAVASEAIKHLDTLGFVGVLELGSNVWQGLGRLFGVELEPREVNVTSALGESAPARATGKSISEETRGLLEERSAADRIVYDHALEAAGLVCGERLRFAEAAFEAQLSQTEGLLDDTQQTDGSQGRTT